jgi:glycosyltransferase involved in cell wall biosynthesis
MTPQEREEASITTVLEGTSFAGILFSHIAVLLTRPRGYLRGFFEALRFGRGRTIETVKAVVYFSRAVALGRWITASGCLHCHTHFASSIALLISSIFPVTFSATLHGPDEFTDPEGFGLARKLSKARLISATSYFALSQIYRFCPPQYWRNAAMNYLGVDPEFFEPSEKQAAEPPEIVCVARLAPVKAQRILIRAAAILVASGREFKLRFVGDGSDRGQLEELTRELSLDRYVIFDGWLNEQEVKQRLRGASIFSLASFAEGQPVVLMEAMAMEIPCVAPSIMGVPELIRHGQDGLLTAPADPAGLAATLAELLDDESLRLRIGAAGRQRITDKFNLGDNVRRFAEKLTAAIG